jgi:ArsR family transcriptional regulator, arsenate/arsenite/antimonite-responsive transcriptional repressor
MDEGNGTAVFRALGEPVRLRIVRLLGGGERCACELLADLSVGQPTLSHHMKVLTDCGLVAARRSGLWVHYSLRPDGLTTLRSLVDGLGASSEDGGANETPGAPGAAAAAGTASRRQGAACAACGR